MAIEGVDYSWSRPSPAALYRAGKRFAVRYVGPGSSGKHLSKTEAARLLANRINIALVAEGVVRDPLRGYHKGQDHARSALSGARAAGVAQTPVIYFAVDWDLQSRDLGKVKDYLTGAASILGRDHVGVYGGYRTVEWLRSKRWCEWFWQTYAWSGGRVSSAAHLYQYHNGVRIDGADADLCRARFADFGQVRRWAGGSPPPPIDPPPPQGPTDWDYNAQITSVGNSVSGYASNVDGSRRALIALRNTY